MKQFAAVVNSARKNKLESLWNSKAEAQSHIDKFKMDDNFTIRLVNLSKRQEEMVRLSKQLPT